jgi:hypothetical protein
MMLNLLISRLVFLAWSKLLCIMDLFYFDIFPNITLALSDVNIVKALTLNVLTSGYMIFESSNCYRKFG